MRGTTSELLLLLSSKVTMKRLLGMKRFELEYVRWAIWIELS